MNGFMVQGLMHLHLWIWQMQIWSVHAFPGNRTHDLCVAAAALYNHSCRKAQSLITDVSDSVSTESSMVWAPWTARLCFCPSRRFSRRSMIWSRTSCFPTPSWSTRRNRSSCAHWRTDRTSSSRRWAELWSGSAEPLFKESVNEHLFSHAAF